ncbi:MAG: DNA polymerase III subunit gamma/tau, partial [Oligoflexia bacterium]|nr:DNA polymerase III subunit gamma/tau [Oligoflexia bacterium]
MSYQVLARKYRPQDFSSVSGQEHVTRTLSNAIKRDKISHAYLLCGPRGVGKTSIARIFSKALNCQKGPTPKPCLKCTNCLEIAQGISLAVREIDGASHNSVDNVRELIDSFRSLPAPGSKYKIYIIDEVHMLSTAAFNALLKSLEEPPPHTVFILATTEPHKIPETVISRCQRHDLRALSAQDIQDRLRQVSTEEKIKIAPEALRMIARYAEGSMRDAHSILDRVQAFCEDAITAADVGRLLGSVERRVLFDLSSAVFQHDTSKVLSLLEEASATGLDIGLFLKEFATHYRELLVARFGGAGALERMGLGSDDIVELQRQAASVSATDLQDLAQLAREGADAALRSAYPKYVLEALLVRMALRENVKDLQELIGMLSAAPQTLVAPQPAAPSATAAVRLKKNPKVEELEPPAAVLNLDWAAFIKHVAGAGQPLMAEQLKYLSVQEFGKGVLKATGPEFSVRYLESQDNTKKIKEALSAFSQVSSWSINLRLAEGGSGSIVPGSLAHRERQSQDTKKLESHDAVENDPNFKSLQRAFPGSKI